MRFIVLLMLAAAAVAAQTELSLATGQVVAGEVIAEDDIQVTLRMLATTRTGTLTSEVSYQKSEILRRRVIEPPTKEYQQRLTGLGRTSIESVTLGSWCLEHGLRTEALLHARKGLELQPDSTFAANLLKALGQVKTSAGWVDEAATLKERGMVRIGDSYYLVTEGEAQRTYDKALRAQADTARQIKAIEDTIATAATRGAVAGKALGEAETASRTAGPAAEGAKSKAEALAKALAEARKQPNPDRARIADLSKQRDEAMQGLADTTGSARSAAQSASAARLAQAAAKKSAETAAVDLAKAKERLALASASAASLAATAPPARDLEGKPLPVFATAAALAATTARTATGSGRLNR